MSDLLRYAGVRSHRFAYTGPKKVQIDLTDRCIDRCIACWNRSPLLAPRNTPDPKADTALPFARIVPLLHELKEEHVVELFFSGGGEPTLHPRIIEVIATAKSLGFSCGLNTSLVTPPLSVVHELVAFGLDRLKVSLWAVDPVLYRNLRGCRNERAIEEILEKIRSLVSLKASLGLAIPAITLYSVITILNYREILPILRLAASLNLDLCEFVPFDRISDSFDSLLLTNEALETIRQDIATVKASADLLALTGNLDEFERRIGAPGAINACYDREAVNGTPCMSGWFFARIKADGSVCLCLKSGTKRVGNIHQSSFSEIWYGEATNRLRGEMIERNRPICAGEENDPDEFRCNECCDNLGDNRLAERRLSSLSDGEHRLLDLYESVIGIGG